MCAHFASKLWWILHMRELVKLEKIGGRGILLSLTVRGNSVPQ